MKDKVDFWCQFSSTNDPVLSHFVRSRIDIMIIGGILKKLGLGGFGVNPELLPPPPRSSKSQKLFICSFPPHFTGFPFLFHSNSGLGVGWGFNHTICPRSSYPFYTVSYYIKLVTTSWTHSIIEHI